MGIKKFIVGGITPILAAMVISAGAVFADNPHITVGPAGYNTNETLVIAGSQPTPTVGPGDHVVICHALGNVNGNYNQIAPSAGDVFGHAGESHQSGMDIIPPFTYVDNKDNQNNSLVNGQNWNTDGMAIYNNGCVAPEGGQGGGTDVCANIQGVQTEVPEGMVADEQGNCVTPGQGGGPQTDCDGDTDNSPQSECETTTTTTTSGTPQVLGASTTNQVAVVPVGSVNGGEGAASRVNSSASMFGLVTALVSVGSGLALLNRKQN